MSGECNLPYQSRPIDISAGDEFHPAFLTINPNNKAPAIVDPESPDSAPIALFASGPFSLYLAAKTDKFMPEGPREHYQALQGLMLQGGGPGPMLGQAHRFKIQALEKIDYAIKRYTQEATRLYGVLNKRLPASPFIGGNEYSIADMLTYPWACAWTRAWNNLSVEWDDHLALPCP